MKRRDFVGTLALGAASCALPRVPGSGRLVKRIGLELYSVRNEMRADPEGTLTQVKAMGYDDVELLWSFGNFGRTPAQVRASLDATGLRAPSCHMAPEVLLKDWELSLETAHRLGQQYLIVPSLPAETDKSLDAWKRWADHFNEAGAVARKADLWLAFHNEPSHSRPLEGTIPIELFAARTDPAAVRLQLDTGNMRMGGGDPMAFLKAHQARICSFHLKDVTTDGKHDTELGEGAFDLRAFLAAVADLDRKPLYVEQEGPAYPMASARRNAAWVRNVRL